MTPIIQGDVTAFAGQLASLDPVAWTDILAEANQFQLSTCDTDQDRRMARILLAAHIGQMIKDAKTGAAGPVTSSAVGDIRRSYGLIAMSMSSAGLQMTRYGQLFSLTLQTSNVAGPEVI
jgi:hypothetical protein